MRIGASFALLAAFLGSAATPQDRIALSRTVYVEKIDGAAGLRTVEPATSFRRGDRVILMIEWTGAEARKGTVVRSAIPTSLAFQQGSSEALEVSVDGGRKWGRIGHLRVGERLAAPEEVTHVRLKVHGKTGGRMTYSAIVR
ncbi:MAG: hypothetical protein KDD90_07085 [Sphingomonadaceae bacterium]|nr:hypothetical protein [Sphingomonadaceae bacterium]